MSVSLSPIFNGFQGFSIAGLPLAGGLINTYLAGTSTRAATYTDNTGGTPNANPIQLDGAGLPPNEIWLTTGTTYKFVFTDSLGLNARTFDNIGGIDASGSAAAITAALAASSGSSLVGYTQGGSGSVARTVQTRLRDRVSVKDFGAKGDGTTDDTAAIQAAITWLNPNAWNASFNYQQGGGTVFFPKGVYRITSTLYLNPYVILEGEGCDGWTGGTPPFGVTTGTTPADGSAIFADFGATTSICAIDSTGYNIATGVRYGGTTMAITSAFGTTYTFTHGVGLRKIGVFCTNLSQVGVRFMGSPLCKTEDVSIIGFETALMTVACWNGAIRNTFANATQIGYYANACNAMVVSGDFDLLGWGTSSGSVITNNNAVTAGNKPAWWSANDTANYNGTSIYLNGCTAMELPSITSQHCGRALYSESSEAHFGALYVEDLPWLSSGVTPGAINAYNATALPNNQSLVFDMITAFSNGTTLFNNFVNTNATLLALGGTNGAHIGYLYGPTGTGTLLIGPSVNRNVNFETPSALFDSRIVNMVPTTGTWTPSPTSLTGSSVTYAAFWTKVGSLYHATVTINGTGLAASAGSTSLSTPFNGTAGFPAPARNSAAGATTAGLAAVGCGLMKTDANLYLPTIASTTQIVLSFTVYGV